VAISAVLPSKATHPVSHSRL